MFSFLKSKRQKWKEQSEATFANFIPALKGMDGQEIGFVLDLAANIRRASTTSLSNDDSYELAFCDPMSLGEDDAFRYLKYWKELIVGLDRIEAEMAKGGALCIWWLSLMGGTIPEARVNARIMWGELERGFEYCEVFIPKEMVPKGFGFDLHYESSLSSSNEAIFLKALNKALKGDQINEQNFPEELKVEIIEFEMKNADHQCRWNRDDPKFKVIVLKGLRFYGERTRFYLQGISLIDNDPVELIYKKYDLTDLRK